MSYQIKNMEDVYKFSLPLYDYLKETGNKQMSDLFEDLVNDCFDTEKRSLEAHKKAYKKVLDDVNDLPPDIRVALEDSLELMK